MEEQFSLLPALHTSEYRNSPVMVSPGSVRSGTTKCCIKGSFNTLQGEFSGIGVPHHTQCATTGHLEQRLTLEFRSDSHIPWF